MYTSKKLAVKYILDLKKIIHCYSFLLRRLYPLKFGTNQNTKTQVYRQCRSKAMLKEHYKQIVFY